MSGGILGGLPSFAQGGGFGLGPGLMDLVQMQMAQQGQEIPQATPPGFTGYQPQTPPTGAPTAVMQPGAASAAGGLMGMLAPFGAQAGEMPQGAGSGYVGRVVGVESNGDDNAKNPRSSATGAGQFISSTWLDQVRKNRPDLAGLPDGQILALRSDPVLSRQMVEAYGNENGALLRRAGLPDNDGTRYLSHFLGSGGARSVLSADPSAPVASVLGGDQVAANPHIRGMSAGQLIDWAARKMAGGGGSAPAMQMLGTSAPAGAGMGATAMRGGFGLGGVEAHGPAMLGQASPTAGLAALAGQPTGLDGAAPRQPAGGTYGNVMSALQAAAGGGQQGGGFPAIEAPGGRAPTLAQARKAFDPGQFYNLLRSRGLAR